VCSTEGTFGEAASSSADASDANARVRASIPRGVYSMMCATFSSHPGGNVFKIAFAAAVVAASVSSGVALAQTPPAAPAQAVQPSEPPKPNDYAQKQSWLCRPDLTSADKNACDIDLSTTVVAADGTLTREAFKPNANAPIDCFYVYPTISTDPTPNADMNPDPAEMNVIKQQAARFNAVCKV